MSDAEPDPEAGAPWIRVAGAIILGFALVELVSDAWVAMLLERVEQARAAIEADDVKGFDRQEEAYRLLGLVSPIGLFCFIFRGWSMAAVLAAIARSHARLRVLAGGTAVAFAASTASWARHWVLGFSDEPPELEAPAIWLQVSIVGQLAAWCGAAALVLLRTRGGPRSTPALVGAVVAFVVALTRLAMSPLVYDELPSWWIEPVLGLGVPTWVDTAGAIGLGLGLWLAGNPTGAARSGSFDAAAARALRFARKVVAWRLVLAVGVMVLMLAGAAAARRAQQAAMLGRGSSSGSDVTWMLDLAPWVSFVELALAVLMIAALGATVLQRRSRLAAALAGGGAVVLLLVTFASFSLEMALYSAMRTNIPGMGWGGSDIRDYTKLAAETQPTLRWLGLGGMTSIVVSLMVLVRATGRGSLKRPLRFLAIAVVLTAGWLHGRDTLDELGTGVLLLVPFVLAMVVWMLLDLVTFLREVADALDEPPAAP